MPDTPPPPDADGPPGRRPLTPAAIDAVLADFRAWLESVAAAPPPAAEPDDNPVDLATLVAALTALRHEVNLQTKAARAQTDQLAQALESGRLAPGDTPSQETGTRQLVEALIDAHDAIERSVRDLNQQRANLEDYRKSEGFLRLHPELTPRERVDRFMNSIPRRRSFWQRLRGSRPSETEELRYQVVQLEQKFEQENIDKVSASYCLTATYQRLDASIIGLRMSRQRIERAMIENGIEPVQAIERPFDPETMEALEAVPADGRPAGEVVEEVQRGYRWRGRIVRYAHVRVAR